MSHACCTGVSRSADPHIEVEVRHALLTSETLDPSPRAARHAHTSLVHPLTSPDIPRLTCTSSRVSGSPQTQCTCPTTARWAAERPDGLYDRPDERPQASCPFSRRCGLAAGSSWARAQPRARGAAAARRRRTRRGARRPAGASGAAGWRRARRLRSTGRARAPGCGQRRRSGGARCSRAAWSTDGTVLATFAQIVMLAVVVSGE